MRLKSTLLIMAITLSVGFVSAQYSTDGVYAIENVSWGKFITPGTATGAGVAMSAGNPSEFKWIIRKNGDKYNILSEDEQYLLGGDGTQGYLYANTQAKRDDATGGALITFVEVSTGTRFEVTTGTTLKTFNGNRNSGAFVGMGADKSLKGTWRLLKIATWTGTTSNEWNVASNWSGGTAPASVGGCPVIPSGVTQPVISGSQIEVAGLELADASTLTMSSAASLKVTGNLKVTGTGHVEVASGSSLITNGTVQGTAHIFHRSTTFDKSTGKYSLVGSPVAGASTSSLGSLVYSYNEAISYSSNRFVQVVTPETMGAGDAYFSAFTGAVSFTGTPNTGDVTVALAYDVADGGNAGFNLVSNPYPAAIDYTTFVNATTNPDIDGTIYLWDDGGSDAGQRTNADYITVNSIGVASNGSGRSGAWNANIGSAQGFFVKANKAAGSLKFNDAMKVAGNNADANYFRQAGPVSEIQSLKLSLKNAEGLSNESLIGFVADATAGFDRMYDAHKMGGANGVKLYSLLNENPMAIQGLPIADESIIPLGITVADAGEYTINLKYVKNLAEGKNIYLEDMQLNQMIDLKTTGQYTFSGTKGTNEKRFNLIVSSVNNVLAVDVLENNDLDIRYNQNGLTISSKNVEDKSAQVSIYDLSGAVLLNQVVNDLQGNGVLDFQFQSNRIYVLRVTTESTSIVSKIAFN